MIIYTMGPITCRPCSTVYLFMHSKQHELYVLEEDGKMIGFCNYYLHPDDDSLVTAMSGRFIQSAQNKEYFTKLNLEFAKLNKKRTNIHCAAMLRRRIQENLHRWKVCYISHFFCYKLCDRLRLQRFVRLHSNDRSSSKPLARSYSESLKWLNTSDMQLTRFLSGYSPDYIPVDVYWKATRLGESGLRRVFALYKCFVTEEETAASTDRIVVGFSYSRPLQCRVGVTVEVNFYGDDCDVLIDHFAAHLRHYVTVTGDDVTLFCFLHFPLTIDAAEVERRLEDEVGTRYQSDQMSVTKAVHYIFPMPQPKL